MAPRINKAGMVDRVAVIISSGGLGDFVIGPAVDETHVSPVGLMEDGAEFNYYRVHDTQTFEWGRGKFLDGPTPVIQRLKVEYSSEADNSKVDFPAVANTCILALGPDHRIGVSPTHGRWTGGGVLEGLANVDQLLNPDDYDTVLKSFVGAITGLGGEDIGGGALSSPTWDAFPVSNFARSFLDDADIATFLATVGALAKDGSIAMTGLLTLSGAPTAGLHAATKAYVDGIAGGLKWKDSVRVASVGNLTLSNTQTVDGIALIADDRVLVKNQSSAAQNGIYTVVSGGAWTRTTDADSWDELVAAAVFVEEGTVNANTAWNCTVDSGGTLNTTAVTWIEFFGGSLAAGLVIYDHTTSGLAATTVQQAIDELAARTVFKSTIAAMTALDVTALPVGQMIQVMEQNRGGTFKLTNAAYTGNIFTKYAPDVPSGNLHWARIIDDGRVNILWGDTNNDNIVPTSICAAAEALGTVYVPESAIVLQDTTWFITHDDIKIICEGEIRGLPGATGYPVRVQGDNVKILGGPTLNLNLLAGGAGNAIILIEALNCYIENPVLKGDGAHASSPVHIIFGTGGDGGTVDTPRLVAGVNDHMSGCIKADNCSNITVISPDMNEWGGFAISFHNSVSASYKSGCKVIGGKMRSTPSIVPHVIVSGEETGTGVAFTVPTTATRYGFLASDGTPFAFKKTSDVDNLDGTHTLHFSWPTKTVGETVTLYAFRSFEGVQFNGAVSDCEVVGVTIDGCGDAPINSGDDYNLGGGGSAVPPLRINVRDSYLKNSLRPGIVEDRGAISDSVYENITITDCGWGAVATNPGGGPWDNYDAGTISQSACMAVVAYGKKRIANITGINTNGMKANRVVFINGTSVTDPGTASKPIQIGKISARGPFVEPLWLRNNSDAELLSGVDCFNEPMIPYPEIPNTWSGGSLPASDYWAFGTAGSVSGDSVHTYNGRDTLNIAAGGQLDMNPLTEARTTPQLPGGTGGQSFFRNGIAWVFLTAHVLSSGNVGVFRVDMHNPTVGSLIREVPITSTTPTTLSIAVPMHDLNCIRNVSILCSSGNVIVDGVRLMKQFVPDFTSGAAGDDFANLSAGNAMFSSAHTWTGAQTFNALVEFQKELRVSNDLTPGQITATQNDYTPTGLSSATVLRLSSNAAQSITGMTGGADGRLLTLINTGSFTITLEEEHSGSTAANRFTLGGDTVLVSGGSVTLWYDSTSSRWRPFSQNLGASATLDNTWTGINTFNGLVELQKEFRISNDQTTASLSSNQNDYNPTGLATATVLRISSSGIVNITGLVAGADGRILSLINVGDYPIKLISNSALSSAANRFVFGGDCVLASGASTTIWYDATSSKWRPFSETVPTANAAIYGGGAVFDKTLASINVDSRVRDDAQLEIQNSAGVSGHTLYSLINRREDEEAVQTVYASDSAGDMQQQSAMFTRWCGHYTTPGSINNASTYKTVLGYHMVGRNAGSLYDVTTLCMYSNHSMKILCGFTSGVPWETAAPDHNVIVGGNGMVLGVSTTGVNTGFRLETIGDGGSNKGFCRFGETKDGPAIELGYSSGGSAAFMNAYNRSGTPGYVDYVAIGVNHKICGTSTGALWLGIYSVGGDTFSFPMKILANLSVEVTRQAGHASITGPSGGDLVLDGTYGGAGDVFLNAYSTGKVILPTANNKVQFGTATAGSPPTLADIYGYILINDGGGTSRKLCLMN